MGPELIAETDGDGHVLWVWIVEPKTRRARPVRDPAAARQALGAATCHGASLASVERWLAGRNGAGAASSPW